MEADLSKHRLTERVSKFVISSPDPINEFKKTTQIVVSFLVFQPLFIIPLLKSCLLF